MTKKKQLSQPSPEYPKVKDVLVLMGAGSVVAACILLPGITPLLKPFLEYKRKEEEKAWKRFNSWRLKSVLKRLYEQKVIEVIETQDGHVVKITEKGKKRLLKYNLDNLELIHKQWDRKWRIIIYDVMERKGRFRRSFQKILRKLAFLQLQKSVYLTPYPCENEIEYLRQIHEIGKEVVILTVSGLENEQAYKEYFGLN